MAQKCADDIGYGSIADGQDYSAVIRAALGKAVAGRDERIAELEEKWREANTNLRKQGVVIGDLQAERDKLRKQVAKLEKEHEALQVGVEDHLDRIEPGIDRAREDIERYREALERIPAASNEMHGASLVRDIAQEALKPASKRQDTLTGGDRQEL